MALQSQGTLIQRGDGASPEVFATIPGITDFNGPGGEGSIIDATDLDSTAREKLAGLPDEGQLTLTVHWLGKNDTVHLGLWNDKAARTLRNFRAVLTDSPATTYDFAAFVTGISIQGAIDDKITADVTLEITDAVTQS